MIGAILSTDMQKHFNELGKLKGRINADDYEPAGNDKEATVFMAFHLSDISNSAKPFHLCKNWIDLLFQEFFTQGDMERSAGRSITFMMDRTTVNVAKSQIGFLDVIINPSFTALALVLPKVQAHVDYITANKDTWPQYFAEYEQKMQDDIEKVKKIGL